MTTQTSLEISSDCAWHYTSAAGLLGIIEGHSLRATSAAFMNDANEMKTGVSALRLAFERMKDTLSDEDRAMVEGSSLLRESSVVDSFLVSASSNSDLLTIWRNYGGGQVAYAIGFDRSTKLAPRENIGGEAHPAPPPGYAGDEWDEDENGAPTHMYDSDSIYAFGGTWRDVVYVEREGNAAHEDRIRDFVKARKAAKVKGSLIVDVGSFADSPVNLEKDNAFVDERELRIILELNPSWKFVKHRPSRYGVTPYVELATSNGDEFVPARARELLPIRHIKIGPSSDPLTAERALRRCLDNNGYGGVDIGVSVIPYR